jgi:hypothetical protein
LEEFEVEIPILTKFIEGLKLFFASKRLKWLTLIFFFGAFTITIWQNLALMAPILSPVALMVGGVFPTYFLITGIVALLGLSRFVADEESYRNSLIYTFIWFFVSIFVLIFLLMARPIFNWMFIGVAFLGWIGFQSYFSTRSSLGYAESVVLDGQSRLVGALYVFIYFLNYVVIWGAVILTFVFVNNALPTLLLGAFGAILATVFNFVNGLILAAERKKSTASNISFLGLFISFYSAYFIYNVMKGYTPGLDLVAISISVFFILYTMSSVGRSLASRAELDTRWKLSKELAATFTFFLASGFMFVDAMFSVILGVSNPSLMGGIGDAIKLFIFPLVAFIMELNFIRKTRKEPKEPAVHDEIVPEEDVPEEAAEPEIEGDELETGTENEAESVPEVKPDETMMEEAPTYTEEVESPEAPAEEETVSEEDSEWE